MYINNVKDDMNSKLKESTICRINNADDVSGCFLNDHFGHVKGFSF